MPRARSVRSEHFAVVRRRDGDSQWCATIRRWTDISDVTKSGIVITLTCRNSRLPWLHGAGDLPGAVLAYSRALQIDGCSFEGLVRCGSLLALSDEDLGIIPGPKMARSAVQEQDQKVGSGARDSASVGLIRDLGLGANSGGWKKARQESFSRDAGLSMLKQAVTLEPDNVAVKTRLAVALVGFGRSGYCPLRATAGTRVPETMCVVPIGSHGVSSPLHI
jgi:hypothetical protein